MVQRRYDRLRISPRYILFVRMYPLKTLERSRAAERDVLGGLIEGEFESEDAGNSDAQFGKHHDCPWPPVQSIELLGGLDCLSSRSVCSAGRFCGWKMRVVPARRGVEMDDARSDKERRGFKEFTTQWDSQVRRQHRRVGGVTSDTREVRIETLQLYDGRRVDWSSVD